MQIQIDSKYKASMIRYYVKAMARISIWIF